MSMNPRNATLLSEGGFENGMSEAKAKELGLKYVPGIYVEISNVGTTAGTSSFNNIPEDVEGRMIFRTVEETAELIGCDAETLRQTILDYDNYVMGVADTLDVEKLRIAELSVRSKWTTKAIICRIRTSWT